MLLKWHYQLEKKSWLGCNREVLIPAGNLVTKDKRIQKTNLQMFFKNNKISYVIKYNGIQLHLISVFNAHNITEK